MGNSSWLNAVCVAAGCALSVPVVQAQDCERRMLAGPGFGVDGLTGSPLSARAAVTWDPDGAGPLAEVAVIAGEFSLPGRNVCTWNGREYAPLGEGLAGAVRALIVVDGRLIAGGEFVSSGTGLPMSRLASWNGSSWEPFGGGADGTVYALHMHNGELYAGGAFNTIGDQPIARLARFDGAQWHAVGDAPPMPLTGQTSVRALETHEGDLYAAGNFDSIGGVAADSIARWNGAAWAPLGSGVPGSGVVHALHSSHLAGEPQLLVGGAFNQAGGLPLSNFARWNGAAWIAGDARFGGTAGPLQFTDFAGRVIAAGAFVGVIENSQPPLIPARGFAQWDGQHWSPLASNLSGTGQSLAVYNNELILGGQSVHAGIAQWAGPGDTARPVGDEVLSVTTSIRYGARLVAAGAFHFDDLRTVTGLAEWDGARWRPFGNVPVDPYSVTTLAVDGDALVVFGDFTAFAGIPATRVARWSDGAWHAMGALPDAAPSARVVGGRLHAAGGAAVRVWDGETWQALPSGITGMSVVAEFQNSLTVAGTFTAAAAARIMRYSDADTAWLPLDLPGGEIGITNGAVTAVETFGNQLVIAGTFTSAFGLECGGLVIWNGAQWVCPAVSAVSDIALAPDGVLVVGSFDVPGAPGYRNLALWNGADLLPITADNPTRTAGAIHVASSAGEVIIFASEITSAGGRTAYDWTRVTREGGVPSIAQQPHGGVFTAGDTVQLAVTTPSGYEPLTYQWRKGKVDIVDGHGGAGGSGVVSGTTTDTLTITNVGAGDAGDFSVLISTECGHVQSDPAPVGVRCAADFNRDGVVNSTDVSDFINAWFLDQAAGTLITDINHDGVVNSTDVSDFINLWFEDAAVACG